MKIIVRRIAKKETYTIGKLYVDGVYQCDTLEPTWRNYKVEKKVKGKSAIPEGNYPMVKSYSKKFGKYMPFLVNVPNFQGVMIHTGNTAKDTEGCILVGKNIKVGMVLDSRNTFRMLWNLIDKPLNDGELTIEIR